MKSFWWFEEKKIAGMARPGFNTTSWFDLPFEQAVVLGWIGQHPSGKAPRHEFERHLQTYAPKIAVFYDMSASDRQRLIDTFRDDKTLQRILSSIAQDTELVTGFDVKSDELHFEFCRKKLQNEVEFLKQNNVQSIVTLTERHHNKEVLKDEFDLHHFSINDLHPPTVQQAHEMASILKKAQQDNATVAVHCLAGIGRTSTMLIAAHMILGKDGEALKAKVAQRNPRYKLTGPQAEFLRSVAETL